MHYIYTYYINIHIYLGFLSGGINSNSFVPLPNASRILDITRAITAENSPLHIARGWTQTGYLWFPSPSC